MWQSWQPTAMALPPTVSTTPGISVNGGQTSMSKRVFPAALSRDARAEASPSPSARRPFIFQFPAINLRRAITLSLSDFSAFRIAAGHDRTRASGLFSIGLPLDQHLRRGHGRQQNRGRI